MARTQKKQANQMWGGHYSTAPDALMAEINASIHFDHVLFKQDIRGSLAHVAMLAQQGIVSQDEAAKISEGLKQIEGEFERGEIAFDDALEDIHMHVEARLKQLIGDVAGKLHTARSRNDQVATDFRLYVRDALEDIDTLLIALQQSLISRADEFVDTIMPGFTHLQTAQPVTMGHHLMAYVEMFGRDRARVISAMQRVNECPLGAAALAGTSFPIDRHVTAKALGFDRPLANSLDAVSARDFALEFLSVASICATHLSRLAEEMVIWSSAQFGFMKLSQAFTSGSSIMPQKRNPDAAELVRAKVGRINGALISLLTVMKGLALAYNKDMQEDKEPVFEAYTHLRICLLAMSGMIADFTVNQDAMLKAASQGFSTATDLADWLVRELGPPFRDAHHVTGRIVVMAEEQKCQLHELSLTEMQSVHSGITGDVFNVLSVEQSVASRTSFGGTAPKKVKEAIVEAKKKYQLEG